MESTGSTEPPRSRRALLALFTACPVAALVLRLCVVSPGAFTAVGALALLGLGALAIARLRVSPRPGSLDVVAALGLGASLAAVVALGGYGAANAANPFLRRVAVGWAAVALALAAFLLRQSGPLRRLESLLVGARPAAGAAQAAAPPRHLLSFAIAPSGLLVHGAFLLLLPPLLTIDSYVNLFEPDFFTPSSGFFHHPPVYAELVKGLGRGPHFLEGLVAIVALQHALVILGLGFLGERIVRIETRSPLAGALAGLFLATDPHLAAYAQAIMTEVVSIVLGVGAVALLVEASRRARSEPWLVGAGVAAALATLTRQVFELWPIIGAAWLLWPGAIAPRRRGVAVFLVATLAPLAAFVWHNFIFLERAALTAATGRNLCYRVADGMPDLTDPGARADDEMEHARRVFWANREALWVSAYNAMERELRWNDARVDAAIQRFYVEQIRRHPFIFLRVTAAYVRDLLVAREELGALADFHDIIRPNFTSPWDETPAVALTARERGALARFVELNPTSHVAFLAAFVAAPLLARRRARALALLALGSVLYFVGLTALVEWPLFRYRLPAVPFIVFGAAAAGVGAVERLRRPARLTDSGGPLELRP